MNTQQIQDVFEPGTFYTLVPLNGPMSVQMNLLLLTEHDDQRLIAELHPVYWRLGQQWSKILAEAGVVLADPQYVNPDNPVGHSWEKHEPGRTWRWDPKVDPFKTIAAAISGVQNDPDFAWNFRYTDGGHSEFYEGAGQNAHVRKQFVPKTGRTMIGVLMTETWVCQENGASIDVTVQFRRVTAAGEPNSHSELGKTQVAFAYIGLGQTA